MALEPRPAAAYQRLVLTASEEVSAPLVLESVGCPVEFLLASREVFQFGGAVDPDWATTAVYVLIGGPEVDLGPGDPVRAYDELLGRSESREPPDDPDGHQSLDQHEHTPHWRARFYTGLTRDALRRLGEHAAKPWWNRALLCRQSPPWPYEIADIGYLEGELHRMLDGAFWLKREGRASREDALLPDREHALRTAHLPAISAAVRLLGVPLDGREHVEQMLGKLPKESSSET